MCSYCCYYSNKRPCKVVLLGKWNTRTERSSQDAMVSSILYHPSWSTKMATRSTTSWWSPWNSGCFLISPSSSGLCFSWDFRVYALCPVVSLLEPTSQTLDLEPTHFLVSQYAHNPLLKFWFPLEPISHSSPNHWVSFSLNPSSGIW